MSEIYSSSRRVTRMGSHEIPIRPRTITISATSNDGEAVCVTKTFQYEDGSGAEVQQLVLSVEDMREIVMRADELRIESGREAEIERLIAEGEKAAGL